MGVVTKKLVTLEDGTEGEITGYRVGESVGLIQSVKDVSIITCDFAACHKGPLPDRKAQVIVLDQSLDAPDAYWKTLTLGNAKNEVKVFCSKKCLYEYLQTDFVSVPIPGSNVIEMPKR